MQTHIIPINNMRVPYVLTGYESMVAIKSDDRFCITAEDDGIVEMVNKNTVVVNYNTLGKVKYKYRNWTTKEESGVCYTHRLIPNVVKGDKVSKDDALVYNTSFFAPSIFNKRRVLYRQGDAVNVALVEDIETYEDSARISKRLNSRLGTKISKVKSFLINCDDNITNLINIGDKLTPNDILFTKYDKNLSDIKDPRTLEIMKKLNSSSPKAKVTGEVVKIQLFYNCDINEMSDSIKHYVLEYDKSLLEETGYNGRVDSSYKLNGNPLQEGYVEVKIYVEIEDNMSIGDKAIIGNQLKFTVGDVYEHEIRGEDGTPVDMLFSMRSIGARIVTSPLLLGTTNMLLDKLGKLAADLYFNKK